MYILLKPFISSILDTIHFIPYTYSKIIKFSVQEVDNYFEKNPFRIKELYSTEKHLITRGLKDE